MMYLSGHICALRHPRLGFLLTPDMGQAPPDGVHVAADNACFSNPTAYSNERYERFLNRFPRHRTVFATAPDVRADHAATVERSIPVLRMIRTLGLPAAFVAQDGWDEASTPWNQFDVLFVGGTTE